MALFTSLPNETLLAVCQALDDSSLLALCRVSKRFHILALDTFLCRHGISRSEIESGDISVTSLSLRGLKLALFVSSIKKLTCQFEQVTIKSAIPALTDLVSRAHIGEVDIIIHYRSAFRTRRGRVDAVE